MSKLILPESYKDDVEDEDFSLEKQASGISVHGPTRTVPDAAFLASDDFANLSHHPNPYGAHPWVYAAIRAISLNIASVPVSLQRGSKDDPVVIDDESEGMDGQLFDLFEQPNEMMSREMFLDAISILLNLEGMAITVLDRSNERQIPKSMMPISCRFIRPVIDYESSNFKLLGWMFQDGPNQIPLLKSQVVVVRFYNPDNPIMGLAPIEAAFNGVNLDFLAASYSKNFFENDASPGGFLAFDKYLGEKQAKTLVDQWEQRHRGPGNTRKIGILWGGGKYQTTGTSQRDMEYIKQREWNRSEILAVFKVPETEINMYQSVSFANASSQDKSFWLKTLIPIMQNIRGAFRHQLINPLRATVGKGLRFDFDWGQVEALQAILTDKTRNAQILYQIGFPANMINRRLNLGFPKLPWGDMWYPNRSVAPITDIVEGNVNGAKPPGPSESNDPDKPEVDEPEDEDGDPPDDEPEDIAPNERRQLLLVAHVVKQSSRNIVRDIRTYLWRLRCCQLGDGSKVFDDAKWRGKLERKLDKHYREFEESLQRLTGEEVSHEYNLSQITDKIHSRVASLFERVDDKDKRIVVVRNLFNRVRDEDALAAIVCTELLTAAKSYFKTGV